MQIMLLLIHSRIKKKGPTGNNDKKNIEIMVALKYLGNFCRTLEMPLINYGINIDLNWSKNRVIVASNADKEKTF